MQRRYAWFKSILMIMSFVFLAGCATGKDKAIDTDNLLVSAGFKMMSADTTGKFDHLKTLPQRQMFRQERKGKVYFVYADASSCKCLYYGDKKAYDNYQQELLDKKLDVGEEETNMLYREDHPNWGMWGSFSGPYHTY
jgi:hypothetical protein